MAENQWVTGVISPYLEGPHNSIYNDRMGSPCAVPTLCPACLLLESLVRAHQAWKFCAFETMPSSFLEVGAYTVSIPWAWPPSQ